MNIHDVFLCRFGRCELKWKRDIKLRKPLIKARLLLLPVSTAQDPAKQNQHSDPWQNQADYHILISQTVQVNSLSFGSAVLLLQLDSSLIVSDLSNEAPSQNGMIDCSRFFFLHLSERQVENVNVKT